MTENRKVPGGTLVGLLESDLPKEPQKNETAEPVEEAPKRGGRKKKTTD